MIKVLHLITSLGMSGGGAEANLVRLVQHIDRRRFSNAVVTMTDVFDRNGSGLLWSVLRAANVSIYSLAMRRGVANPWAAIRLCGIVRQFQPDILQTWMYHADLLGLLAGRITRVPSLVWNIRCSSIDGPGFGWQSRLVRKSLIRLSSFPDVVVTNSRSGLESHRALGYRPRRWLYIPNSLDLDRFKPDENARAWLRSMLILPPQAQLIGLIARYHPVKDHQTFIRAASLLARDNPDTHFVLAGPDQDCRHINELVAASGAAARFHLLGPRLDVNRITAGLDIACSTSAFGEGTSNVLAEAMACGVPCVATDVGDSAFMIQAAGRVVPPKDPQSFARACRELLQLSSEERQQLGLAARQRMSQLFSISSVVARYEELYEQLAPRIEPRSHHLDNRTSLTQTA